MLSFKRIDGMLGIFNQQNIIQIFSKKNVLTIQTRQMNQGFFGFCK